MDTHPLSLDLSWHQVAIETCNLNDADLRALAKKTKLLIATVGPYGLYGEHAFKACAENGTHYLDVTGEVPFVSDMIKKYESTAKSNGCIMIPQIGIESAPADLVTWTLVDMIRRKLSAPTGEVVVSVHDLKCVLESSFTFAWLINPQLSTIGWNLELSSLLTRYLESKRSCSSTRSWRNITYPHPRGFSSQITDHQAPRLPHSIRSRHPDKLSRGNGGPANHLSELGSSARYCKLRPKLPFQWVYESQELFRCHCYSFRPHDGHVSARNPALQATCQEICVSAWRGTDKGAVKKWSYRISWYRDTGYHDAKSAQGLL